jgi:RNAse (barnase) inhibitor barstar
MSGLDGLTDGSLTPGVYRVLDPADVITAATVAAGWSVAVVAPAERTRDLYLNLAEGLELPDWFGHNLDALWDVLTDRDRPTLLIMVDWTRYARARPERWSMILELFRERCSLPPPFAVVLANPS